MIDKEIQDIISLDNEIQNQIKNDIKQEKLNQLIQEQDDEVNNIINHWSQVFPENKYYTREEIINQWDIYDRELIEEYNDFEYYYSDIWKVYRDYQEPDFNLYTYAKDHNLQTL